MEFRRKHPDVRRKHHRSSDDGVSEGSKRRKHSHHRHHRHHRHRNEDLVSHPPPPVLVDIEEVEILAAADVNLKKKINDEPQIRKRSMSRDNVRERSVSRSTGRVHHHERDVKSYSDTSDRGKTSDSLKKAKDYHSERDRDNYRGRDRNREREREMEMERSRYKDFRHSKRDEPDYHFEKIKSKGSAKVSSNRNGDSEVSGERYVDEQDDYEERVELKLAQQEEEDIDRIKEESKKRRQAIFEKYKHQQSQQVKTDVVVGPAQPSYSSSSSVQFGSFEPMTPNPPNPKQQTQPHPSVPSNSRPNIKSLPPNSKQNPLNPPRSYLTLIVQWGKGVRSTHEELVEGVEPVFTVHTLGGHNVPIPRGIELFPFDVSFGGVSRRASQAIYHCRNIRQNTIHMRILDREKVHNYTFWNTGWQRHRHQCGMSQDQYYDFIHREFRLLNGILYPALMESCVDAGGGKSELNVTKFLRLLGEGNLFPSVHVAETHFSVDQEKAKLHQELVELKFYFSCTEPRVSYSFPLRSNYNRSKPVYVTM